MWPRWVFACAVGVLACEPVGGRSATPGATSTPTHATSASAPPPAATSANLTPSASAPSAGPSCVVPLAETPPPKALPATDCPRGPVTPLALSRGYAHFPEVSGAPRVSLEVAATEPARAQGLMYRTELAPDEGMLFVFPREAPRSFWMRNTCLPLDMLFLDRQGYIVGILEQVPVMNEHPRSVPCPAAFVLEVNAGWVRDHGVKPGQRVTLDYTS
ncbi:MAG: DUF192 domain-containing protein [Polyangiaceae bacterium]|nr:DUF192 domain-containing protein [Polyangiaceae bacterium]MCW5791872.1 DUF192 domain-containing protein [Polyangiaceae bacterium]